MAHHASTPAAIGVSLSSPAKLIGYACAIPFLACLLAVALGPYYEVRDLAQRIAVAYGSVLLAFSGAVHWGLALAGQLSWTNARMAGAVLPLVPGTAAVVLGGQRGLAVLVVSFGLFWLYEHNQVADRLPAAYLRLRRNLTLIVCTLLTLTMFVSESAGLA